MKTENIDLEERRSQDTEELADGDDPEEEEKERVIFLWSVPATGHLNPTLCFTNQLLLRLDEMKVKKIVFYCGTAFRELILNLPNNKQNRIEFRDYRLEKHTGSDNLLKLLMTFDTRPGNLFRVFQCWENAVNLGTKHIFKNLFKDINRDKPVLILYDQALFFPKLAFKVYTKKFKRPAPLHSSYVTTFLCDKDIYPTWTEMNQTGMMGPDSKLVKMKNLVLTAYDFMKYVFTYYKTLWWDHKFTFRELFFKCDLPFARKHLIDESMNLVFILPELQPKYSAFEGQSHIKFVGPAVDEEVRSKITNRKIDMQKCTEMIEEFLKENQSETESLEDGFEMKEKKSKDRISYYDNYSSQNIELNRKTLPSTETSLMRSDSTGENFKRNHKPFIYVSMGTVFSTENSEIFEIIVEACKHYTEEYSVIVSTGEDKLTAELTEKYSNNEKKILFVSFTPQIEILKRAHLFISHAGMNSVSEALNYGVPILCLPLGGDQPLIAWRVADELGIGIKLQVDSDLSVSKVKNAIGDLLDDPVYRKRVTELSVISKRFSGHKLAVQHVINYLRQNESFHDTSKSRKSVSSTSNLINSRL